ncbi:MAG: hypothetical protein R3B99_07880 [Polyangiales bacterium]
MGELGSTSIRKTALSSATEAAGVAGSVVASSAPSKGRKIAPSAAKPSGASSSIASI